MSSKTESPDEKRNIVLRTTASCLDHLVPQMGLLLISSPEFKDDVNAFMALAERITDAARNVGYVGLKGSDG